MANENIYQSDFTGQQMDERFRAVATLAEALTVLEQAIAAKYTKPAGGIPATDLDADVNAALAKANSAIQSLADYYTKSEVDAIAAAIAAAVNSTSGEVVTSLPSASASTLGKIYYVGPTGGEYARYVTNYDGTTYSWLQIGTTAVDMSKYASKDELSQLDQKMTYPDNTLTSGVRSGYINTNSSTIDGGYSTSTKVSSMWITVSPGDVIRLYGEGGDNNYYRFYAFVNSSYQKITAYSGSGDFRVTPLVITIPDNCVYLAVNFYEYDSSTDKVVIAGGPIDLGGEAVKIDKMWDSHQYINLQSIGKYPKRGVNLISQANIETGKHATASGSTSASAAWSIVRVNFFGGGVPVYLEGFYAGYYCIWDANGNILAGKDQTGVDFHSGYVLPEGAAKGIFSVNYGTVADVLDNCAFAYVHPLLFAEINNRAEFPASFVLKPELSPTDYNGRDFSTFRKIVCCGDSLTEGGFNFTPIPGEQFDFHDGVYSYPAQLGALSGREVINLGDSGETAASWYEIYQNSESLEGVDCAILEFGVNDAVATLDTVTRQAFINIVTKLKTNNKGVKIFICGIINGESYQCTWPGDPYYTKDQFLRELYEELWDDDSDVYFLDLARYGHLRDKYASATIYLNNYNSGHLSAYGYNRLAQDIYNYIGWIMHNNWGDFRGIQFIGSDFEYNG